MLIIMLPKQDLEGLVGPDAWEASPGSSSSRLAIVPLCTWGPSRGPWCSLWSGRVGEDAEYVTSELVRVYLAVP